MKIGSAQFPPQSLRAWSPSAHLSIGPKDLGYLETVSLAWYRLRIFSDRWLNIRLDVRRRHDPRARPYEEDSIQTELFQGSVLRLLHESNSFFFRRLYERIDFLARAEVRKPSEVVSGRLRNVKPSGLNSIQILPLRAMIWRREQVCLVWVDVPLGRRLVSETRDELRFALWLDNVAKVRAWLKKHRVDGAYETFFRESDSFTGENGWWELEATDPRDPSQRRDHPMLAVWNLLRLVGTDQTKWEAALASNPFKEELTLESIREISDKAIELLSIFQRPFPKEVELVRPNLNKFLQTRWPVIASSFPFRSRVTISREHEKQ